jgi:type III secretion system FlhB-like substrate exporter
MKNTDKGLVGVALDYDSKKQHAPRVMANAKNEAALELAKVARRYGIKVHLDCQLAGNLSELELDSEIPVSLYSDVAQVLLKYGLDQ